MIGTWIADDQQSRLAESLLNLIRERSWRESSSDGRSANMRSELENGALSIRPSRNDADVGWIFDGGDCTGGQQDLFPRPFQVDDKDTIGFPFVHVLFHLEIDIPGANVRLADQKFHYVVLTQLQRVAISRHLL
jgi:hypothetical protein